MEIKRKSSVRREAPQYLSVVETAPKERWQHGQDRASHHDLSTADRVSQNADTLKAQGLVGDAELFAAERFWMDYIVGVLGGSDPEGWGGGGGGDPHVAMILKSRALAHHNAVKAIIGDGMTARLVACFVDNMSFTAMGAKFFPRENQSGDARKSAKTQMATMLTILAGLYQAMDRKRKNTG